MPAELLELVNRFASRKVLLVGDFMLDRYIFGDAERISPEAPVPVLRVLERQDRVGGAGSVALNVVALGARVRCFGLLGRDGFGDRVEAFLKDAGADTTARRSRRLAWSVWPSIVTASRSCAWTTRLFVRPALPMPNAW